VFNVRSIVSTSASAVATSSAKPALPRWLALPANTVSARSTGVAIASGTRLCRKYFCSETWNCAKSGKALKTASITVTSGTSAISVVKVRLPAVRPRRSSRKRARSVRSVSNQGQRRSVSSVSANQPAAPAAARGEEENMATMMPA
jgi:hypothetical protein